MSSLSLVVRGSVRVRRAVAPCRHTVVASHARASDINSPRHQCVLARAFVYPSPWHRASRDRSRLFHLPVPYVAQNRGHRVEFRETGLVARTHAYTVVSAASRCVGRRPCRQQQDRRSRRASPSREAVEPEAALGPGTGENEVSKPIDISTSTSATCAARYAITPLAERFEKGSRDPRGRLIARGSSADSGEGSDVASRCSSFRTLARDY